MVKYSQDSRRIGIPVEIHGTNQKRCENKTSNRMPNEKKKKTTFDELTLPEEKLFAVVLKVCFRGKQPNALRGNH